MAAFLKSASLVTLVVQNTALVMLLRYSRTMEGPRYLSSTAVASMEVLKLLTCLIVVLVDCGFRIKEWAHVVREEIIDRPFELVRLAVPSLLYTVQNNLLYLALSNLDAVVYQMCYQMKILTTAIFSVMMLDKSLSTTKWVSLILLTLGVAVVQTSNMASGDSPADDDDDGKDSAVVGFVAVLLACVTSGFSGVYFERILKASNTTLWIRNIQMAFTSILLSLVNVYTTDRELVTRQGFFYGYNNVVWGVVMLQAFGGLTVAVVVKYADNILKGFAASYSIITSLALEMVFMDFWPSGGFIIGGILVNLATYLYAKPEQPKKVLPL
jgi:UDP-sugar transporter A1/2/3